MPSGKDKRKVIISITPKGKNSLNKKSIKSRSGWLQQSLKKIQKEKELLANAIMDKIG